MVLPIGFFSPLPLAMMIPFMATQSLLMMYAAGSGWQFGKRKISAKTNDEIDAMSLSDLMKEQTLNLNAIIPDLHQQMADSYALQIDIFQEMIKIIPAFFESLMRALGPLASEFQSFNTTPFNQQIPLPGGTLVSATEQTQPTDISHENLIEPLPIIESSQYSQAIFRAMSLEELIKGINSGRFTGSDLSLARHVLAERQASATIDTTLIPTVPTAQQTEHQAWLKTTNYYKSQHHNNASKVLDVSVTISKDAMAKVVNLNAGRLYTLSQDYRNPNDSIRRSVLELRQEIANGWWYKVYYDYTNLIWKKR